MCCAVGVSEYGGLGARGRGRQRRRVVVDVAQVGRRRLAQARAQPGRRVRRQPLLQVLQRRLERAHHAQLQPTQPSSPAPPRARRPPRAARRPAAPRTSVVWMFRYADRMLYSELRRDRYATLRYVAGMHLASPGAPAPLARPAPVLGGGHARGRELKKCASESFKTMWARDEGAG